MGVPLRRLGRYELVARIGEGGMAEVHLARQRGPRQFEKLVVVKLVHPQVAARPEFGAMLLDEARIAALVKHPNCVDIYDLGEEDGTLFIAMEYLEGESLAAILRAAQRGPRLDAMSTAKIVAECAAGLHAAHELRSLDGEALELVHQDVTPGNVFVLYTGQVKLVDFGVATIRTMGEQEMVRGKSSYLAPELLAGARANRRTDIFALGVVLWEALTLRRLFWAAEEEQIYARIRALDVPAPSTLAPNVSRELDEVCLRALARDPEQRFATAQEMRDALTEILRHASWAGGDGPLSRYMQTIFAGRIKARQHLLRELAATRALRTTTVEQLQAIHDEPPTPVPPPAAVPATATEPAITDAPPATAATAPPPAASPSASATPSEGFEVVAPPPPRRRAIAAVIAGGALVLGAAIVAILALGGTPGRAPETADKLVRMPASHEPATPAALAMPAPSPSRTTATAATSPPPPAGASALPGAASAPTPIAVTPAPPRHHHDPVAAASPVENAPTAVTAPSLYKQGLQDFVAGDTATAIDRFRAALARDPSFAPAYRGMGMAYERAGDADRAARAYRQYLARAADAADASQIRARLEKLQ